MRNCGRALLMLFEAIANVRHAFTRRRRKEIVYQMYASGILSLGVITVVGLFTGMILTLQVGLELRSFGQERLIGAGTTIVMLREMGPFMSGLIVAAAVGSAMAAQIGTMVVSEEIAALEVMSINPVRFLVMPRLFALVFMMPLLAVYTNILGIVGGSLVGHSQLGVSFHAYFDAASRNVALRDLYVGLLKSLVNGVIICTVACHQGFSASEGAVGVGHATRRTVVVSFLSILVIGYIITRLFYE